MSFDASDGARTRWRKGQSGNPGGRPKTKLLSEALKNRLGEVVPGDRQGRTYAVMIAENIVELACGEGSVAVAAANEIANRIEGRATQSIEISDFAAELRQASDEELKFHLEFGRFPTEQELALLKRPVGPKQQM